MSKYNRNSIDLLASILIGTSDVITFLFAILPAAVFAGYVYLDDYFYSFSSFFAEYWERVKEAWIAIAICMVVSAGVGYLLTLLLRVLGQLLNCLTQIEENTRSTGKPA